MNLTERLERKGKAEAERHWLKVGTGNDCASADYQAGHSSTHAILVELAMALKGFTDADHPVMHSPSCNTNEFVFGDCTCGLRDTLKQMNDAQDKLEKYLGGNDESH